MKQYFFNTRQQLENQLEQFADIEIGEKLSRLMKTKNRLEDALRVEKRLILSIHGGVAHIGRIPYQHLDTVYLYD